MNRLQKTRQGRRSAASVQAVALALLGAGLLTGCGAQVSEGAAAEAASPSKGESPEQSGPVLVAGTVTRNGDPVSDTPVQLQVWPEQEDTEVGDTVALKTLGPVTTDEDGRYSFALRRKDVPAEYLAGDQVVNYDVGITDPLLSPISTSSEYHPDEQVWTEVDGKAADGPKRMDFDLGTMTATEPWPDGDRRHWDLHEPGAD